MGVLNRTSEFHEILLSLSAKGGNAGDNAYTASAMESQSELNAQSARIASDINDASLQVHELRRLAKKNDVFEERTLQQLTYKVEHCLKKISQEVNELERQAKVKHSNRHSQVHVTNMVETLKLRFYEVSKDFKEALEVQMKTVERWDRRSKTYVGSQASSRHPAAVCTGSTEDPEAGVGQAVQATSMQTSYRSSRGQALQNIQRSIEDVARMMQKMAEFVVAQEHAVQRIEHDTEAIEKNVSESQDLLLQYLQHISGNRSLIVKVLLILLFFVVFFVVFLA